LTQPKGELARAKGRLARGNARLAPAKGRLTRAKLRLAHAETDARTRQRGVAPGQGADALGHGAARTHRRLRSHGARSLSHIGRQPGAMFTRQRGVSLSEENFSTMPLSRHTPSRCGPSHCGQSSARHEPHATILRGGA